MLYIVCSIYYTTYLYILYMLLTSSPFLKINLFIKVKKNRENKILQQNKETSSHNLCRVQVQMYKN